MTQISDHRHDASQKVLYAATENLKDKDYAEQIRGMVNRASSYEKTAGARVFADPDRELFPVGTLEDTVLSKIYFDAQREKMAEAQEASVDEKLASYLELYSVPESLFAYTQEKTAEADTVKARFLLPSMKLCKVASEEDLHKASKLFKKEASKLDVSHRVEFATNFIKAASDIGVDDYPQTIAKYAGLLDTDMRSLEAMLEYRAAAASRKNEDGSAYIKLAMDLRQLEQAPTAEERTKLAELIYKMDEKHEFTDPKYDAKLPCAYSIVFNKEAMADDTDTSQPPTKAELVAQYGEGVLEALEDEDGEIDMEKLKKIRSTYGKS